MSLIPYLPSLPITLTPSSWSTDNAEGPWNKVSEAIHACHIAVHVQGAPRIATDIRIGTRIDRVIESGTGNEGKVKKVEDILEEWTPVAE